jgi:hypothetical protein
MSSVVLISGIFLIGAFFVTEPAVKIALTSFGIGYLVAAYVPFFQKRRHVQEQNALLDRCRAILMQGARAAEAGDIETAERLLSQIRNVEQRWRFGNSIAMRVSVAVWPSC